MFVAENDVHISLLFSHGKKLDMKQCTSLLATMKPRRNNNKQFPVKDALEASSYVKGTDVVV